MSKMVDKILAGANITDTLLESSNRKFKAKYIVSSERANRRSDEKEVELYSDKIMDVGDSFEMDGLIWYVDKVVYDPDRGIKEESGYIVPNGPKTDSELDFVAERLVYYLNKRKANPTKEDVIDQFRMMSDDYADFWARGLRTKSQEDKFLNDLLFRMEKFGFDGIKESKSSGKRLNRVLMENVGDPVDKWETDLTFDGKNFYYTGKKVSSLSLEEVEALIKYLDFNGICTRWSLSKDLWEDLLAAIWKAIPDKYFITVFGGRGVVTHAKKKVNKVTYIDFNGRESSFDGAWYIGTKIKDGNTIILSKDPAPDSIKYTDISNSIGKKHSFNSDRKFSGKKIQYEDDTVFVYDKDGNEIYVGTEDYEPMKDEAWKFDSSIGAYRFKDFIKNCI